MTSNQPSRSIVGPCSTWTNEVRSRRNLMLDDAKFLASDIMTRHIAVSSEADATDCGKAGGVAED